MVLLEIPMDRPGYMHLRSRYFSLDIRKLHNIDYIISNYGYMYVEINKSMYGLKQAAIIVYLK